MDTSIRLAMAAVSYGLVLQAQRAADPCQRTDVAWVSGEARETDAGDRPGGGDPGQDVRALGDGEPARLGHVRSHFILRVEHIAVERDVDGVDPVESGIHLVRPAP